MQYKLCRVRKVYTAKKAVPMISTHDGRTIRYADPLLKTHDTIQLNIETGKIMDHIKFDTGKSSDLFTNQTIDSTFPIFWSFSYATIIF